MHLPHKRLLALVIGLCLQLAALPALAEDTQLQVRADSSGGDVTAEVVLRGDMTAAGVQFELSYDSNLLRLSNHQDGSLAGTYTVNDTQPGKVSLVWFSVTGAPVNGESTVLRLNFEPLGSGETSIAFNTASSATPTMVVDNDISNVAIQTSDATLTVARGGNSPASTDTPVAPAPVPTEVYVPPVTPIDPYAPMTIPPEEYGDGKATPSAAPTPKATPKSARNEEPVTETPAPVPSETPVLVEVYEAPQLVSPVASEETGAPDPQIEVVAASEENASAFPWLWVAAGGTALLVIIGLGIWKRGGKK